MAHLHHTHTAMNSRSATAAFDGSMLREPVLWKLLLLIGVSYLVWSEKLSIVLDLSPTVTPEQVEAGGQKIKASLLPDFLSIYSKTEKKKEKLPRYGVTLAAGAQGNLTFAIDPGYANRHDVDPGAVNAAMANCIDYVERFAPVAVAEMRKYGIPASITLAQGLLESDAGQSKLARSTNNHFGMKCFSNRCKKGHCANFSDDSHKDFFVRYGNTWGSYRAHSQFLKNSKRYAHLFDLNDTDYRAWAHGLAKAGYATDKRYADKLITIINNLQLARYDRQ